MALVLLLLANVARAQTPTATDPPIWTDILTNTVANTGVMNMASGNYFAFSDPASSSTTIPGTDLTGINYTLALASNLTTLAPASSYTLPTFMCGTGKSAVSIPETPEHLLRVFQAPAAAVFSALGF